jgi:glutathione S-transferase
MIIVHHLNNSRSQRVLWLFEELGLPYEIKHYQRDPRTMFAPATLRAVHPLGKSPVVEDNGAILAESGAIIEYLADTYGDHRLAPPPGTPERRRYSYFLHYAEGSLMPLLFMKLVFIELPKRAPALVRPVARGMSDGAQSSFIDPQLKNHLDFLEAELGHDAWFAGSDFSAADIQMSFPLEAAAQRAGLDASRPRLKAWLDTIHARPAYQRALAAGGPYELLH